MRSVPSFPSVIVHRKAPDNADNRRRSRWQNVTPKDDYPKVVALRGNHLVPNISPLLSCRDDRVEGGVPHGPLVFPPPKVFPAVVGLDLSDISPL